MKKMLSLLVVALFATTSLFAEDISIDQALQIARKFAKSPSTQQLSRRKAPMAEVTPTLAHAVRSKVAAEKDNVYILNLGNDQGFVVVSGENSTGDEILGYCDHGSFSLDDCPVQLKDLLDYYSEAIDSLRQNPALASKAPQRAPQNELGTVIVGPLLTTAWNQWGPYNDLCPEGCPSGCVPTAVAQVMNYWKWPKQSSGRLQDNMGTFTGEDFSGHVYDWDNMLDNYGGGYNAEQAAAVAFLMADIGKAFHTGYKPNGSGTHFIFEPLVNNFGYSPDIKTLTANIA